MNKLNQFPALLARVESQWQTIHPTFAVSDAALLGALVGVAANIDSVGVQELKRVKLTQTEHDVLACARRQGKPYIATPSLLLFEVKITSGALTNCINRLVEKKLVVRTSDVSDLRSKPIQLTLQGVKLIDEITKQRFELAATILTEFSTNEKKQLKELIMRLHAALNKHT